MDWRRFQMDAKGKRSSGVSSERGYTAESRWTWEGTGSVLNPSAICVFKVAVKYLTVNNMAHKRDTGAGLCLQRRFSGHLPLMQAAGLLPYRGVSPGDFFIVLLPRSAPVSSRYGTAEAMTVLRQRHDLHWGHRSRDRFAELASEEETLIRDLAGCTGDKLKGNYSKLLLQRERTKLSTNWK